MAIVRWVLEILLWLLVLRVFLDFLPGWRDNAFGQLVWRLTEPLLAPLRQFMPPVSFGDTVVDVTAFILMLILQLLQKLIS